MKSITINGQPVTQSEEKYLKKLLRSDWKKQFNDGNADITLGEAVALMDRADLDNKTYDCASIADADLIPRLSRKEYFAIVEIFQRKFPHKSFFNTTKSAMLFAKNPEQNPYIPEKNDRSDEVVDVLFKDGPVTNLKISESVLSAFKACFNHKKENGFLLFANRETGVIEIAIRSEDGGHRAIYTDPDLVIYYTQVLEPQGYIFCGYYHSHTFTPTEAVVASAKYDEKGEGRFDESLLSTADQFSVDDYHNMDVVHLLGSAATLDGFQVRAYMDTSQVIGNIPGLAARLVEERYVKHYRGIKDNYEMAIQWTPNINMPHATTSLDSISPYKEETSVPLNLEQYQKLCEMMLPYMHGEDASDYKYTMVVSRKWNGAGEIGIYRQKTDSKNSKDKEKQFSIEASWQETKEKETLMLGYHTRPFSIVDYTQIAPLRIFLKQLEVPKKYWFDIE